MTEKEAFEENLSKLRRFSAFRERCSEEIRQKMYKLGIKPSAYPAYLKALIEESFLDDERYARIFVRSKFNQNQWGRIKIRAALAQKKMEGDLVEAALGELDEGLYLNTLSKILNTKNAQLKDENSYERRQKLIRFGTQKGYETSLVITTAKKILP